MQKDRLWRHLAALAVLLLVASGGGLLTAGGASAAPASRAAALVGPGPVNVNGAPYCPGGDREYTYADQTSLVMDAIGFGNPTDVQINTFNGGLNQYYCAKPLSDGYDAIVAQYGTNNTGTLHYMCLNVDGNNYASGTHIRSHQCDTVVTVNEQFALLPEGNGWAVEPAYSYHNNMGLCLNVAGGLVQHARVILYSCSGFPANEQWNNATF